jgi:hypothetical protein
LHYCVSFYKKGHVQNVAPPPCLYAIVFILNASFFFCAKGVKRNAGLRWSSAEFYPWLYDNQNIFYRDLKNVQVPCQMTAVP